MRPKFYVKESIVMVYEDDRARDDANQMRQTSILNHEREIQPHQVDVEVKRMVKDAQARNHVRL